MYCPFLLILLVIEVNVELQRRGGTRKVESRSSKKHGKDFVNTSKRPRGEYRQNGFFPTPSASVFVAGHSTFHSVFFIN